MSPQPGRTSNLCHIVIYHIPFEWDHEQWVSRGPSKKMKNYSRYFKQKEFNIQRSGYTSDGGSGDLEESEAIEIFMKEAM